MSKKSKMTKISKMATMSNISKISISTKCKIKYKNAKKRNKMQKF